MEWMLDRWTKIGAVKVPSTFVPKSLQYLSRKLEDDVAQSYIAPPTVEIASDRTLTAMNFCVHNAAESVQGIGSKTECSTRRLRGEEVAFRCHFL